MNTQQPKILNANLLAAGLKLAIVVARWHELINQRLLDGAVQSITRLGGKLSDVTVAYVPGCFELPQLIHKLASSSPAYDAIIGLGTVIKGHTDHYDFIAGEAVGGLAKAACTYGIPVTLGILTTDNLEQALERAGSKHGNKGAEAATAAIEMANLYKLI